MKDITNAEAIAIGVERFLENNKEWVGQKLQAGAKSATEEVAGMVGMQISGRVYKFMQDNKQDFFAAMASQAVIGALGEKLNPLDPAFQAAEEKKG